MRSVTPARDGEHWGACFHVKKWETSRVSPCFPSFRNFRGLIGQGRGFWADGIQFGPMAEERKPTTFWQHFGMVRRRAFRGFQWTRDMLLGLALGVSSILLQSHWGLITVQDWREHWGRWILSIVIPYCVIVIPHLMWRFGEAPWKVHQGIETAHWNDLDSFNAQLLDARSQNALLQERISKQTFPDNRPKITIDRWGNLEVRGVCRSEMGFYLTNHGDTALEVQLEGFTLAERRWVSTIIASIGEKQTEFLVVEQENCPLSEGKGRWALNLAFVAAERKQLPINIKYRDFNRNWYRSVALAKYVPIHGYLEMEATQQEKLGSS